MRNSEAFVEETSIVCLIDGKRGSVRIVAGTVVATGKRISSLRGVESLKDSFDAKEAT